MPTTPNQRLKLLYLTRIVHEQTDENRPLTTADIIAELGKYDISVERKTFYADIELLRLFGLDIVTVRGKSVGYYLNARQFELPELKLLVDAVQSSRFITEKKSNELIGKLASLTSNTQAKQLRRQIYVAGRAKTMNSRVYYSIDEIHLAISQGRQITFKYFDYNAAKKRVYRKNGGLYQTTPVTLCWDNDNYYLIAYSTQHESLRHYRVDRMSDVKVCETVADIYDRTRFSVADHVKRVFGMYNGELVNTTLRFDASLVNVVLDHFGKGVRLTPAEENSFEISVEVFVSPVFLSWIFQFGNRAKIISPEGVVCAMRELLKALMRQYDDGQT